jgi:hypothetical protein
VSDPPGSRRAGWWPGAPVAAGEWWLLAVFVATSAAALLVAGHDRRLFARLFTDEDGPIEWLTAVAVAAAAAVCWRRVYGLWGRRRWRFLAVTILAGTAFAVATGEELSWGQRLLRFSTPAPIARYNDQREMTIHNLKFGTLELQALLERLFLAGMAVGLTLLPWLAGRSALVRRVVDDLAIPVPRARHGIAFVASHAVVLALPGARRWEIHEFLCTVIILGILVFPANREAFVR